MSREKGNKLETKVCKALHINKTTNSGAKYGNGDLANKDMVVECKYRDVDTLKIDKKDLSKIMKLALSSGRDWLYIQENKLGTFALIDFEFFVELFEEKEHALQLFQELKQSKNQ